MNKLNLPPFYIGQKVIYVTGVNMPKYSKHTVLSTAQYPCGCWGVEIATKHGKESKGGLWRCGNCSGVFSAASFNNDNYWQAISFRPIEGAKPPLLTFTQIKETEKEEILTLN